MQIVPESTGLGTDATAPRVAYVVDDDGDLRRSLRFLLATNHICVTSFESGTLFLSELASLRPAPIILDVRMPHIDGTQVLSELARRGNHWPVIVLTGHGEVALAVQCLKSGAVDFLEKPVGPDTLFTALDTAFVRLARQVDTDICRERAEQRVAVLTPREAEVLDRLSLGRSNKQVAYDLSLSPRTVEMHRANAFRHLKVRTLLEAATVLTAARLGPRGQNE